MNYPKLLKKLKKEFPEATEEEISQMISQIPPNLPYPLLVMSIKLTKYSMKESKFLEKLKNNQLTKEDLEADMEALAETDTLFAIEDLE